MSELKHTEGRVVVSVNLEGKNTHKFADGTVIRLERQYNNLNRRETEPVNAMVISGENIPVGSEILIHPNCTHDVNKIFNYKNLSGKEEASDVKYYSVREEDCFLWLGEDGECKPIAPYETALRVFKPYEGLIEGVPPAVLKDVLYVTSGDLKGQVVKTLKACDYQIVFQDTNGREGNAIRFRPNGDEKHDREPEAIAVLHELTKKVKSGKYLVGIDIRDAKPINELVYY